MTMTLDALKERILALCADENTPNTMILMECLRHIAQLEKHTESWWFEGEEMYPTHWMPLPAPPVNTSAERV